MHGDIKLAGDGENRVVNALGVEPAAVLSPEPLVITVDRAQTTGHAARSADKPRS